MILVLCTADAAMRYVRLITLDEASNALDHQARRGLERQMSDGILQYHINPKLFVRPCVRKP